jgi:very-short-patch-repair endonuclease
LGEGVCGMKKLSPGEEGLAAHLQCYKVLVVREYRFDKVRRWRFDFAIPAKKLGIEVEGGSWTNGRHNRGSGMAADCIKYNAAVLRGWRILRFTTDQVISGYAIDTIVEFLNHPWEDAK